MARSSSLGASSERLVPSRDDVVIRDDAVTRPYRTFALFRKNDRSETGEVAPMTIKHMTIKRWLLSSTVAFTCLVAPAAIAGTIDNYSPVTSSRLENPEPGNWMLYRRTYHR